jgi:hypothetical protein
MLTLVKDVPDFYGSSPKSAERRHEPLKLAGVLSCNHNSKKAIPGCVP